MGQWNGAPALRQVRAGRQKETDIRYGQEGDFFWLREYDRHVDSDWINRCLHHGEYVIAADGQGRRGFLRFSIFWGSIRYGVSCSFKFARHAITFCFRMSEKRRTGSHFFATCYMDLIRVSEPYRQQGTGTGLFQLWESEMRKRGAKVLMTSAMTDEPEPQAWHRRNGFSACGQLTFGRYQPTPEVFFVKDLTGP